MLDAAKGLAFLHEEAQKPLIYRGFKTSNILLDSVTKINVSSCASFDQHNFSSILTFFISALQCKTF